MIQILSFGFDVKYWYPEYKIPDADLTLDCRHIFNPAKTELFGGHHSGLEQEVRDFVLEFPESEELLDEAIRTVKRLDTDEWVQPISFTIAFGCMWGKHRSVSLAIVLGERLKEMGYDVEVKHISIEGGWIKV